MYLKRKYAVKPTTSLEAAQALTSSVTRASCVNAIKVSHGKVP